jgi:hypothetical protein
MEITDQNGGIARVLPGPRPSRSVMPSRETDVPGSRLLLRSGGRFCRGVPPAWPSAGVRGTPMIQGWCLSPARIHVQGACGSWIVLA